MSVLNSSTIKNIHCIGIGGIGVSGLAELLQTKGYCVSGSDVNDSPIIKRLKKLGVHINKGHQTSYINNADLVVYSSAITEDNVELQAAKSSGIPLISRGKLLAELMQPYFGIAVVGTHGKTTTTGMIANTFVAADLDPTYIIGGHIRDQETTVRFGKSRYFIAEADESDRSFLFMTPQVAVITNIEADHLENYEGNFEQLEQSFLQFIKRLSNDSMVVLGIDCPSLRSLMPKLTNRVVTFGFSQDADFRITKSKIVGLESHMTVQRPNAKPLELTLPLPGTHNILNALPSMVMASELCIPDELLIQSFQNFPGMGRRFHPHGELQLMEGKALLFEDYGHHPTAIAATLTMAKQAWPHSRIVLVFQPHRYSRTRDLMNDFVRVLSHADMLILTNVYSASEAPDEEGSAKKLYQLLQKQSVSPVFIPELETVVQRLPDLLQPDDIVIFQGAGNIGLLPLKLKSAQ